MEYFRHALAVIHFNKNLNRKNKMKNGVEQVHVVYPKFKNGEAVIRNVKVQQNFGMYNVLYLIQYNSGKTDWCSGTIKFVMPISSHILSEVLRSLVRKDDKNSIAK